MTARKTYIVAALLAALTLLAVAQQTQKPDQAPDTVIKHVPVKPTSPASGEEMYVNYCAVCHGKDGRGTGPAVSALKVPPTDLTTLAEKNGGKYPSMHVSTVLRGETDVPAHGTKDMPVWGPLFWKMSQGHESEVQQRIANLSQYLESIQAK
jgi:mono/diheme cytochrome c family protein